MYPLEDPGMLRIRIDGLKEEYNSAGSDEERSDAELRVLDIQLMLSMHAGPYERLHGKDVLDSLIEYAEKASTYMKKETTSRPIWDAVPDETS